MVGAQTARIQVIPDGDEHPKWKDIQRFVKRLGYDLDEWQWEILRVATLRRGEFWAAFTVAICAPRQNGKNTLLEVLELVKAVILEEQLIIHTAHLADTSKEAFHRLDDVIDGNDWLQAELKRNHRGQIAIWRGNGTEAVEFKNGQRIRFRTRTQGGGRGYAGCSTAIFDEAMFLPEVSMSSILPVISANPDPQVWYTGSAVDQMTMDQGTAFARVRERALAGESDRLAYFEWSLDADSPDEFHDKEVSLDEVAQTNPAFGKRIRAEYILEEHANLDPRTFAVERLGVGDWPPTSQYSSIIDLELWGASVDPDSHADGPVTFAFDVRPDRSASSIAVAGRRADGRYHIEIVERRNSTNWLIPRLLELRAKWNTNAIVCETRGPAGSLVSELEQAGVEVTCASSGDLAQACGMFYDAVENDQIRHLGTPELLAALRGASKRFVGESWAWDRKNSAVDICPLVSSTLALWASQTVRAPEPFMMAW